MAEWRTLDVEQLEMQAIRGPSAQEEADYERERADHKRVIAALRETVRAAEDKDLAGMREYLDEQHMTELTAAWSEFDWLRNRIVENEQRRRQGLDPLPEDRGWEMRASIVPAEEDIPF